MMIDVASLPPRQSSVHYIPHQGHVSPEKRTRAADDKAATDAKAAEGAAEQIIIIERFQSEHAPFPIERESRQRASNFKQFEKAQQEHDRVKDAFVKLYPKAFASVRERIDNQIPDDVNSVLEAELKAAQSDKKK